MEEWYQRKGRLPVTPKEFMGVLFDVVTEKEHGLAQYFSRYQDLSARIDKLSEGEEKLIVDEWARELFLEPVSFEDADLHKSCEQWVRTKMSKQDSDLLEKADTRSTELLANGFAEASSESSLILAIDSVELLNVDIENWLTHQFLCRLYDQKNRILTMISGSSNFARGFRNTFSEDSCFSFNFRDLTLSNFDISHVSQKMFLNLADEDVKKVEMYSAGIPVIVQDIADYLEKKKPLGDVIRDVQSEISDIETLTAEVISDWFPTVNMVLPENGFFISACVINFHLHFWQNSGISRSLMLMGLSMNYRSHSLLLKQTGSCAYPFKHPFIPFAGVSGRYRFFIK
jgi:hypothetical protein